MPAFRPRFHLTTCSKFRGHLRTLFRDESDTSSRRTHESWRSKGKTPTNLNGPGPALRAWPSLFEKGGHLFAKEFHNVVENRDEEPQNVVENHDGKAPQKYVATQFEEW
jgi:hypothetical protein